MSLINVVHLHPPLFLGLLAQCSSAVGDGGAGTVPWSGYHCPLEVVALPLDRVSPALYLPPLWLSRSWLAKHPAPGRGGRAAGQGVALKVREGR